MTRTSALIGLLVAPLPLFAQVSISEVLYDLPGADDGREWIEVYNGGGGPVDLTTLRLLEGGVRHTLKASGTSVLASGVYAVIAADPAKFLADNPSYTGALFDSSFSLSNTGETIALLSGSSTLDSVTYTHALGAAGDGLSLSRTLGGFIAAKPSPGRALAQADIPTAKTAPSSPNVITQKASRKPANLEPPPGVVESALTPKPGFVATGEEQHSPYLWWLALGTVLALGAGAVYLARRKHDSSISVSAEAAEYEIIE